MNYMFHRSVSPFPGKRPYRQVAPVRGLGIAAAVLIGATALAGALLAWVDWRTWMIADDVARGVPGVLETDAYAARIDSLSVRLLFIVLVVNSAVQFVFWLWRARGNAEALHRAAHRRDRRWIIGGWFCPAVNLWVPYQIVRDIWEASDPRTPYYRYELGKNLGAARVVWWWLCWLIAQAAHGYVLVAAFTAPSTDFLRQRALAESVAAGASLLAAVVIIQLIFEISGWQSRERTVRR